MKTRTLFSFILVAMLATGCRDFNRHVKSIMTYPTTAEDVADVADLNNSDAALVVTVADTQYVLYRKNDGERCYAMRYVSKHRCKHDFSGRGGTFSLDEPEQPVILTRTGDNALALTVDSLTIAVGDIIATDSVLTFRFGIDDPDRDAILYLYGKAHETKDVFAETSIQQMLVLSLSLDAMMDDMEESDCALAEASEALEMASDEMDDATEAVDAAFGMMDSMVTVLTADERYAEYSRMDSTASLLGFKHKKAIATGDRIKLEVSGGRGGSKVCYKRMEALSEAAKNCHIKRYTVEHIGYGHRNCRFSVEW